MNFILFLFGDNICRSEGVEQNFDECTSRDTIPFIFIYKI